VEHLRSGDELAFEALVDRYHVSMVRLAGMYASDPKIAEEVAQETWIAVLRGLAKFEGRSSLKTWIFSILVNRAKTLAQREGRYVKQESVDESPTDTGDPGISLGRFDQYRHWEAYPGSWDELPEDKLASDETRAVIQTAINMLPNLQREVITLRDINQFSSEEVCNILMITETNQRVLLHRARTRVRSVLEKYLAEE
jgi:RNA polymerase sigma-70 factor, ECF subfamily